MRKLRERRSDAHTGQDNSRGARAHAAKIQEQKVLYWKKTLLLAASICFSIDVLAQSSTQEREEQQRVKEVQATEMEREVRDVEREMRVAETRLADAARQVAELSSRQIEIVGSTGWNFDLDFDVHDKPVLGITIGVANKNEPVEGVSIIGVSPGGAAAEAGLRSGDVITAVNTDSLSAENAVEANQKLVDVLEGVAQGDVLDVTYLRAGKTSIVEISPRRMTARVFEFRGPGSGLHVPVPSVAPTAPGARFEEFIFISGGGWGDLEMVPLTKDLGRYFGAEEGLLVVRAPTDENFKLRDGDVIELDAVSGSLTVHVPAAEWQARAPIPAPAPEDTLGRNLFEIFRRTASGAMLGASVFEPIPSEG